MLQLYSATAMCCLVQEFIETGGCEIRCLYVDGRPVGAYERRNPSGFLTNVTPRAGRSNGVTVTRLDSHLPETKALLDHGLLLLDAAPWDLAAVDWFSGASGYLLNEINPVPGTASIPEADQAAFNDGLASAIRSRIAHSRAAGS
jgi:glutathione synthase/RimK-type ligase-like ATP-grasp enzyme